LPWCWYAEAINTAVEAVCDLVELRYDPLVKRARTYRCSRPNGGAASVVVALLLFAPRLFALNR